MRVGCRRVVLKRLVVGGVVVLVAPLAGSAQRDSDRVNGGAQALMGGFRDRALEARVLDLVRDELAGRLSDVPGGGERLRVGSGRSEAALEPAPGHSGRVQLVADVRAAERHRVAGGAIVPVGLRVAGQRVAAVAVGGEIAVRRAWS